MLIISFNQIGIQFNARPSAGTNDALQDYHVYTAGIRMNILVEKLFGSIEGTTIILSTLLPNGKEPEKTESINEQYRNIVAYRRARNDKIVLAEMSDFITTDELVDKIHPDDAGYERMASVWWAAFQEAEKEGMLQNFNYTVSMLSEKKLDDNTTDPHLPAYTAPAQPSVDNGQAPSGPLKIWVLVFQIFIGMSRRPVLIDAHSNTNECSLYWLFHDVHITIDFKAATIEMLTKISFWPILPFIHST